MKRTNMKRPVKAVQGFTLTELLVVITIFVVLLGLSAAALLPMRKQLKVIDTPAYCAAKTVEKALRDARLAARQTGVPHSVAFNREKPAADGRPLANWAAADTAPPEGGNFVVILRHQDKKDGSGNLISGWEKTPVVDPWADWKKTEAGGAWSSVTDANETNGGSGKEGNTSLDKTDWMVDHFGIENSTRLSGALPRGTGFHALAAGIPSREGNFRIWRWCWDDLIAPGGTTGAMSVNAANMVRADEGVRVWIDAAGLTQSHPGNADATDGSVRLYAKNEYGGTTYYPYRLGARVTFLPSGEMVAYIGGRPAVIPDGPYTPPFNFTLTPNGFHIVAVGQADPAPTSDTVASRELKRLVDSKHTDESYYTYFVGINQYTGETFVKNRFEMLEWAGRNFPCPEHTVFYADVMGMDYSGTSQVTNTTNYNIPRNACLRAGTTGCANASVYLTAAEMFVKDTADTAPIATPESHTATCCQGVACQWRAAVRMENSIAFKEN